MRSSVQCLTFAEACDNICLDTRCMTVTLLFEAILHVAYAYLAHLTFNIGSKGEKIEPKWQHLISIANRSMAYTCIYFDLYYNCIE